MRNHALPKWPLKLLRLVLRKDYLEEIEGDLEEIFEDMVETNGLSAARKFYAFEVIKLMKPALVRKVTGTYRNNLFGHIQLFGRLSIRQMTRTKLVSTMSLASLVVGILSFILIINWVDNEYGTDRFHAKSDRVYMTTAKLSATSDFDPLSSSLFMRTDLREHAGIEERLLIHTYTKDQIKIIVGSTEYPAKALASDSTFFDFFDFPLNQGAVNPLSNSSGVIVTRDFAKSIFGEGVDPIGQAIDIDCDNQGRYYVEAIVEQVPSTSSIGFDVLLPRHSQQRWRRIPHEFVLSASVLDLPSFHDQVRFLGRENSRFKESEIQLVPFESLYFEHPFDLSLFDKYGNRSTTDQVKWAGFTILFICLLSFVNLQGTEYLGNIHKISVKRTMGASRRDILLELLVSRGLYFVIASFLVFTLLLGLAPAFYEYIGVDVNFSWQNLLADTSVYMAIVIALSLLVLAIQVFMNLSFISLVQSIRPLKTPKLQRLVVTAQYAVSVIIIVGAATVFLQLRHMSNKDLGVDVTDVIDVRFFDIAASNGSDWDPNEYQLLRNEMSASPLIAGFTQGDKPVNQIANPISWKTFGEGDYTSVNKMVVDPDYLSLFDLQVLEGRFFDQTDESRTNKVVINQKAMEYWGLDNIEGAKLISSNYGGAENPYEVIGVVKDYHYEHLGLEIAPLVLMYTPYEDDNFLIKLANGNSSIGFVEGLFKKINPDGIFQYRYLSDVVNQQYQKDQQTGKIYLLFALTAIGLATMGIFTLSVHETTRRTKEMAIRKVNGAYLSDVLRLYGVSILKLVVLAIFIALPISYQLVVQWLMDYAFRIDFPWVVAIGIGVGTLVLATLAIAVHALKAASINPVDSLRSE